MDCERIRENLAAFIDGELDGDQMAEVQAHLAECAECRAELEALRQTARTLAELLEPRAMSESVAESVLATLASERRRRTPLLARVGWALTGAVAAVFILAVFGLIGMEHGGSRIYADEIVDEALADHAYRLKLFKKQVVDSAVIDPVSGIQLIRIDLQLSGLEKKTMRLEQFLTCSNHPKKSEIAEYINSVHKLLRHIESPPFENPEAMFRALRSEAVKIDLPGDMALVTAPESASGSFSIPEDLDEAIKRFIRAKKDLYRGNFIQAARSFSVVVKRSPGSPIGKDAKFWKIYSELQGGEEVIEIFQNQDVGAKNKKPGIEEIEKIIEKVRDMLPPNLYKNFRKRQIPKEKTGPMKEPKPSGDSPSEESEK